MDYRERPASVPGAVLWESTVAPGKERGLILPDGCMDVIWDGRRLFVAGPDSTARWHHSEAGTRYTGIRFSGGLGPALVGVPADEVLDLSPALDALWPAPAVRRLADHVAPEPAAALEAWALQCSRRQAGDPLGPPLLAMAKSGWAIPAIATRAGLSPRQLHRRCLSIFGYGPRRLARVMRLTRALDHARTGAALVDVAVSSGYFDQAHLCREVRDLTGSTPAELLVHLGIK